MILLSSKGEQMNKVRVLQSVVSIIAGGSVGLALAADLPKEGKFSYTACWSGTSSLIQFSKTHTGMSYEFLGMTRTDPAGGMFDRSTFRCVGSNAIFDKRFSSILTCEAVNPDGDKLLSYYYAGDDRKYARETVAGTGKYEGIVVDGTVTPIGPFPTIKPGTFQGCNQQTGTYKLK